MYKFMLRLGDTERAQYFPLFEFLWHDTKLQYKEFPSLIKILFKLEHQKYLLMGSYEKCSILTVSDTSF